MEQFKTRVGGRQYQTLNTLYRVSFSLCQNNDVTRSIVHFINLNKANRQVILCVRKIIWFNLIDVYSQKIPYTPRRQTFLIIGNDILEGLIFNRNSKFCQESLSLILKMLKAICFHDTSSGRLSNILCLFSKPFLSIIPWKHLEAIVARSSLRHVIVNIFS